MRWSKSVVIGCLVWMTCGCEPQNPPLKIKIEANPPQPEQISEQLSEQIRENTGQDNLPSTGNAPPPETVAKIAKLMPEAVLRASLVGALQQMEHEAIAVLKRATRVMEKALPDCDQVLADLTSLRDTTRAAAETAGKILREHRAALRRTKTLKAYQDRMEEYFAAEISAYEKAVARFELLATNEQLLRFNALMKGLTAPLSD